MTANLPSATPTVSASPTSRRPPSRNAKWMMEMTLACASGQKVDQKVPARNEIETREWRVGEHVMHREHDARAQLGRDPVEAILLGEKCGQSLWRHIGLDRVGIEAFTSARHRVRVDVAGEDLQFDVALRGVDLLAKKHGERIGLFAGTATGDPDLAAAGPAGDRAQGRE